MWTKVAPHPHTWSIFGQLKLLTAPKGLIPQKVIQFFPGEGMMMIKQNKIHKLKLKTAPKTKGIKYRFFYQKKIIVHWHKGPMYSFFFIPLEIWKNIIQSKLKLFFQYSF